MLSDFAATGVQELWNLPRLQAYLLNVGSPFDNRADICGCDTIGRQQLDPDGAAAPAAYDTPATDPAPWYDPDLPASGDFLGFMPLTISGLNDNPRKRNVTGAVGGGGIFGPSRALPLTVVVTGLLIGASCCGSEYGLHWLAEALAGCTGDACDGDCLTMYNCCPDTVLPKPQLDAQHKRTFRRAALVDGPNETGRVGSGGATCARGTCGANGDVIEVEFTIVIASPWAWTETTELLDVTLPATGTGPCIDWCAVPPGGSCATGECSHAPCRTAVDACADPRNPVPAPPVPTVPEASFCVPLATDRACYDIDLTTRPQWSTDVPMITVLAGASELRNVRITFYEKPAGTSQTCDQIADANRCAPQNDFVITYVPANGSVTIDGQIGRATMECEGDCRTASTVFGDTDGGPVKINDINCAELCFCIEVDPNNPPAADARVTVGVSGRGY